MRRYALNKSKIGHFLPGVNRVLGARPLRVDSMKKKTGKIVRVEPDEKNSEASDDKGVRTWEPYKVPTNSIAILIRRKPREEDKIDEKITSIEEVVKILECKKARRPGRRVKAMQRKSRKRRW